MLSLKSMTSPRPMHVNIISNPTPALVNPTPALLNTTPGRRFFAPHYRKRRYGPHSFYL